jgi:predicted nucleic acid-binding protein
VIVLDAAALVDVVLDQTAARWLLEELTGEEVCAPAHQPAEVLSALTRLHRAGDLDRDTVDDALAEAMALEQELVTPTLAHLRRAVRLSDRIRVLDGLYVALAEERGCPVLTSDRRLADADPPCEVRVPSVP